MALNMLHKFCDFDIYMFKVRQLYYVEESKNYYKKFEMILRKRWDSLDSFSFRPKIPTWHPLSKWRRYKERKRVHFKSIKINTKIATRKETTWNQRQSQSYKINTARGRNGTLSAEKKKLMRFMIKRIWN